jgi:uncharacterized Zn finger protein (UPF0148 family)
MRTNKGEKEMNTSNSNGGRKFVGRECSVCKTSLDNGDKSCPKCRSTSISTVEEVPSMDYLECDSHRFP